MAQFDWSISVDAADFKVGLGGLEVPHHNGLLNKDVLTILPLLYSGSVYNTDIGRYLLEF